MTTCHYQILELNATSTPKEITKSFHRLALQYHPDKHMNQSTLEEATERYILVQRAYEVLSDPQERAFYDRHRDLILLGSDEAEESYGVGKLFPYFDSACYEGYGDDDKGFYGVYRAVFVRINEEDDLFCSGECEKPGFGDSTSDYNSITLFYRSWSCFSTNKHFNWIQKYDINDVKDDTRQVKRFVERENKKEQYRARKEYNDVVRKLCSYVKKRDPRVIEHLRLVQLEREIKNAKLRELQLQTSPIKRSEAIKVKSDPVIARSHSLSSSPVKEFYCNMCKKKFKSEGSWNQHERSKKHRVKLSMSPTITSSMPSEDTISSEHEGEVLEIDNEIHTDTESDYSDDYPFTESSEEDVDYKILFMMNATPTKKNKKIYDALREHEAEVQRIRQLYEDAEIRRNIPKKKRTRRNNNSGEYIKKKKTPPPKKIQNPNKCKNCRSEFTTREDLMQHLGETNCFIYKKKAAVKNYSRGRK